MSFLMGETADRWTGLSGIILGRRKKEERARKDTVRGLREDGGKKLELTTPYLEASGAGRTCRTSVIVREQRLAKLSVE